MAIARLTLTARPSLADTSPQSRAGPPSLHLRPSRRAIPTWSGLSVRYVLLLSDTLILVCRVLYRQQTEDDPSSGIGRHPDSGTPCRLARRLSATPPGAAPAAAARGTRRIPGTLLLLTNVIYSRLKPHAIYRCLEQRPRYPNMYRMISTKVECRDRRLLLPFNTKGAQEMSEWPARAPR